MYEFLSAWKKSKFSTQECTETKDGGFPAFEKQKKQKQKKKRPAELPN